MVGGKPPTLRVPTGANGVGWPDGCRLGETSARAFGGASMRCVARMGRAQSGVSDRSTDESRIVLRAIRAAHAVDELVVFQDLTPRSRCYFKASLGGAEEWMAFAHLLLVDSRR